MLLVNRRTLLTMTAVAGFACRQGAPAPPELIDVTAGSPAAARLAALQLHVRRVPGGLVRDFDEVLSALEVRCTETRTTAPGLTDIAITAVAAAKRRGRDVTHLQALRALESSIHEGADMKIDCTDAANRLWSEF